MLPPILLSQFGLRQRVVGRSARVDVSGVKVDLGSGDRLLLFTDGITEAEGPDGEEFGMERVAVFATMHAANSGAKMNQQLLAQVTEFCCAAFSG
jgi:serine phosphatase RsbU (regulator of sigma subunit)